VECDGGVMVHSEKVPIFMYTDRIVPVPFLALLKVELNEGYLR